MKLRAWVVFLSCLLLSAVGALALYYTLGGDTGQSLRSASAAAQRRTRPAPPIAQQPAGQEPAPAAPVRVGSEAPDFTLRRLDGQPLSLANLHNGRPVVLVFASFT